MQDAVLATERKPYSPADVAAAVDAVISRYGEDCELQAILAADGYTESEYDYRPLTVSERINRGHYSSKTTLLPRPKSPKILEQKVSDLPDDLLCTIPDVRKQYERELATWQQLQREAVTAAALLEAAFMEDLFAEHDIPANSKFGNAMYSRAWDSGHAYGFSEVASHFEALLPLWQLYLKKGSDET